MMNVGSENLRNIEGNIMYKCKEGGCEYDEKPDYCDCGNDEFEEVVPSVASQSKSVEINPEPKAAKEVYAASNSADFAQKQTIPVKTKKNFSEQYPGLIRALASVDLISGLIFFVCLILTLIIALYPVKEPEQTVIKEETPVVVQNIPSIEKFWNNSTVGVVSDSKVSKNEQETNNISEKVQKIQPVVKIQEIPKPVVKTTPVNNVKTVQIKTVKPSNTPQTSKNTTPKSAAVQTSKTPANTAKPKTTQTSTQPKTQTSNTQNSTAVQTQTATAQVVPPVTSNTNVITAAQKQELTNYIAILRNTIGRKIDFTRVIGDGNCSIVFKINDSGRLVNASFAKQSTNMTLNDAVYSAFMSSLNYNPPPVAYKGEMLTLSINFYNGNFEIALR